MTLCLFPTINSPVNPSVSCNSNTDENWVMVDKNSPLDFKAGASMTSRYLSFALAKTKEAGQGLANQIKRSLKSTL